MALGFNPQKTLPIPNFVKTSLHILLLLLLLLFFKPLVAIPERGKN